MKIKLSKLFVLILISFFTLTLDVFAENNNIVDLEKQGNINVTLKDKEETAIKDAEISLYHIANVKENNHQLEFTFTEELNACEVELKDFENKDLVTNVLNCITDETTSQKKMTNEEGKVSFNDLTLGVYLIRQTNKVEGYSVIDPFLLVIPNLENNKWIYDLDAMPKTDIYKTMSINVSKVWNTDSDKLPNSIEVGLYKENKLVISAILNKENNWNYTFHDIEKRNDYEVREINVPSGYTATYRKINDSNFVVTNTKTLAQTGHKSWLISLLSGLGTILIITGVVIDTRKDHE